MVHFRAYIFDGKRTARKALDTIEDNYPDALWIDDVAIASRNNLGHLAIHSTWAQDTSNVSGGIGWGAFTGGLIGILFGPVGAAIGAGIGGSFGGLMGAEVNYDFDDPDLQNFASTLAKGTSTLVLVGEIETLDLFADTVTSLDYDVQVVNTELNYDDVKALKKALRHADRVSS